MAETLPRDILENIFYHLPIKSTFQCKRVCRTWRRIIRNNLGLVFTFKTTAPSITSRDYVTQLYYGDPQYETKIENYYSEKTLSPIPLVTQHGKVVLKPNAMVGSCNGLVCFKVKDPTYCKDGFSFICTNPMTGEVADIPGPTKQGSMFFYDHGSCIRTLVDGFGYVGSTNEYKVVRICYKYVPVYTLDSYWESPGCPYIEVYTLGSHLGWRDKGIVPRPGFHPSAFGESGVFANGALHWINFEKPTHNGRAFHWINFEKPTHNPERECKILTFGLADEEFWPMPSPPCTHGGGQYSNANLILLGGNLCVVHTDHQSLNKRLDIWVFKKRVINDIGTSCGKGKRKRAEYCYDNTWSWSKEYNIAWEGDVMYTPFVITKRNTVLLWQDGTSNLRCFDPKTSRLEKYWDGDKHDNVYLQAIPHINTLVSLKKLGEI